MATRKVETTGGPGLRRQVDVHYRRSVCVGMAVLSTSVLGIAAGWSIASWGDRWELPLFAFELMVPAWAWLALVFSIVAPWVVLWVARARADTPALRLDAVGLTVLDPGLRFLRRRPEPPLITWADVKAVYRVAAGVEIELSPYRALPGEGAKARMAKRVRLGRKPPTLYFPTYFLAESRRDVLVALRSFADRRGARRGPSRGVKPMWARFPALGWRTLALAALGAVLAWGWSHSRKTERWRSARIEYLSFVDARLHADTALVMGVIRRVEPKIVALDRVETVLAGAAPVVDTTAFLEDLLSSCDLSWEHPEIEDAWAYDVSRFEGLRNEPDELRWLGDAYARAVRAVSDEMTVRRGEGPQQYAESIHSILPHTSNDRGPTVTVTLGEPPHTNREIVAAALASDLAERIPGERAFARELAEAQETLIEYAMHGFAWVDTMSNPWR